MSVSVGDEQIYRVRDYAPSERVRVLAIQPRKRSPRYDVEFLDGEKAGKRESIPGNRLRGPWSGVSAYDELMANWERLDQSELTDHEEAAVEMVFELLIPEQVAEWEWSPVRWVTTIHDRNALQRLIGLPATDLLTQTDWFELDGAPLVSPAGTLMIAEFACRVTPMPVLDWVVSDEKEYREKAKRGKPTVDLDNKPYTTSPEWEYQWYLEHGRPLHELLRSWCGQRAVSMQERLAAAEAEVRRLDELVVRIIDELKAHGHAMSADHIARAHDEERITPANYRPVVDRPLKPSEIPVRYVRAPRRWGY
jgi:hypothetical protein